MTFRLFDKLNEIFKRGKRVVLRRYLDEYEMYETITYYDENSDINEIDNELKENSDAKLFVFDDDFNYPDIYVDTYTDVLYPCYTHGMTPIMKANGTCLTYQEWKERNK